ncbi:MAG: hypothetical protein ACYDHH_23895 [Solirubrobacteraceae bacterium]
MTVGRVEAITSPLDSTATHSLIVAHDTLLNPCSMGRTCLQAAGLPVGLALASTPPFASTPIHSASDGQETVASAGTDGGSCLTDHDDVPPVGLVVVAMNAVIGTQPWNGNAKQA